MNLQGAGAVVPDAVGAVIEERRLDIGMEKYARRKLVRNRESR